VNCWPVKDERQQLASEYTQEHVTLYMTVNATIKYDVPKTEC